MTGAPYLAVFARCGGDRWSPFSRIKSLPAGSNGMLLAKAFPISLKFLSPILALQYIV
jgi:hypothetical protein